MGSCESSSEEVFLNVKKFLSSSDYKANKNYIFFFLVGASDYFNLSTKGEPASSTFLEWEHIDENKFLNQIHSFKLLKSLYYFASYRPLRYYQHINALYDKNFSQIVSQGQHCLKNQNIQCLKSLRSLTMVQVEEYYIILYYIILESD